MRRRTLVGLGVLATLVLSLPLLVARAKEPPPPALRYSPWALAGTPDGKTLFVACGPLARVGVIDLPAREVRAWWPVPGMPRGMAVSPDGSRLAVSLGPQNTVVLVDVATGDITSTASCPVGPEGVAFAPDGRRLFIANKGSRDVAVYQVPSLEEEARLPAGREPFSLTCSPDGATVAVVCRRATTLSPSEMSYAEVTLVDVASTRVRQSVILPSCHLAEAAAFTPDSRYLLVPTIRVRNLLPIVQVARGWVLSSVLGVVDVQTGDVSLMPLQFANQGFADPTGIAVSGDGERAYVASGGADEVAVIDLPALLARLAEGAPGKPERFSLTREYVRGRKSVGDNPRGVAWVGLGAAGDVVVSNRLDDDLHVLDRDGNLRARLPLGFPIPDDAVHRGRRAFFDAHYCFQSMFSCTSCHPEGHTDGLTYDFEIDGVGRNPLLNRSLLGLHETDPFKWSGLNPSLQRQCGARFAMVLTRAEPFPAPVLDDLAAYLLSLPPPTPLLDVDAADEETRASVGRGRRLFGRSRRKDGTRLRPRERCITCHPPPHYTNRQRTDIGTRSPLDDHEAFDVPHLTGTGTKAPYLHDGRAPDLESVVRSSGDRHGFVSDLTDEDIRDLVRFLESL